MVEAIIIFLCSFLIVMLGTPSLIVISTLKNLNDQPNNRKLHFFSKPRIGGVVIFFGMLLPYLLFIPNYFVYDLQIILAALLVTFATGFKDDIVGLASDKKLMLNIIIAAILIFGMDLRIKSFAGILGVNELNYWFSVGFSFFVIVVILNAFNLIDGVDGLASTVSILSLSFFVFCLLKSGKSFETGYLGVGLIGGLIAFLVYNIAPAKIFLGDSGSLILGVVNAILAIKFLGIDYQNQSVFLFDFSPLFAVAALIFPLVDVLRVFSIRMLAGNSPFKPDKNHIHHNLVELGLNEIQIGIIVALFSLLYIGLAVVLKNMNPTLSFTILGGSALIIANIPSWIIKKRKI